MRVGAVDIGSNSMRLLITDGAVEYVREVVVTGLGRGVDATGILSAKGIEQSVQALARFGGLMDTQEVVRRRAVATSACRDALNRHDFFDAVEPVLGVRPSLVSGEEEARLAFFGATSGLSEEGPLLVADIGGGSTEFVSEETVVSIDIGSVRLTDRVLANRPAPQSELEAARGEVRRLFAEIDPGPATTLVGVAGTWTSLAAIALDLPRYDRTRVHRSRMSRSTLTGQVDRLSRLTVEETAAIPSLDPKRAPVILSGSVIAEGVLDATGFDEIIISEEDSLDAVAAELLALG